MQGKQILTITVLSKHKQIIDSPSWQRYFHAFPYGDPFPPGVTLGVPTLTLGVNSGGEGTALVGLVIRYHVTIIMAALIAAPISFFSFSSISLWNPTR